MPLRSLFLDHLWLKVFSLILATLIWLTVHANIDRETREETRRFHQVPISLLTDSAERRAYVIEPAQVTVSVKGPKAVLDELKLDDIHTYVELANHAGATANYRVEVHVPAGFTVALVTPRIVFVRQANEGQ
jgi:YbbR domain-containing protein